jgi:hypothetical protein
MLMDGAKERLCVTVSPGVLARLDALANHLALTRSTTLDLTLEACLPDNPFIVVRDGDALLVLPLPDGAA